MLAHVITVSDRCTAGEREDRSGPAAVEILQRRGYQVEATLIADGAENVAAALRAALAAGAELIITSGGTGVGPRDQTPEGTRPVISREIPGIMELLRAHPGKPAAYLSRGLAGVVDPTDGSSGAFIVNLPGSPTAVREGLELVLDVAQHVVEQLRGGDH